MGKKRKASEEHFFITLILVLVGEIGGGVYAYQQKEQVVDVIRDLIRGTIRNEYAVNSAQRSLIDYLQRKLECCGSDGPDDWVGIVVYDPDKGADIGVDEKAQINQAPASCCTPASLAASPDQCGVLSDSDYPNVWTVGCHEQLGVAVKDNLVLVIGIAVCIAILQIAVMVFTLTLCIGLSRTEYEPANIEKY
ncbi:PREDICTED: tetraspanin-14-like [Priapulus caudatus]|uniref:Tetraspanin n=1 Tax=Priapulus caudatus TaxID=37621 RepID=A0ABM1E379_PRICU|nr:PREDICTED: tetraspanin-14-like [Priapulus caudatus]